MSDPANEVIRELIERSKLWDLDGFRLMLGLPVVYFLLEESVTLLLELTPIHQSLIQLFITWFIYTTTQVGSIRRVVGFGFGTL